MSRRAAPRPPLARDDVVVVGAGIIGLLTALSCASAGAEVTVIDRGDIPNPDATSYDEQRIVRALHVHDLASTRRAWAAERRWRAVEAIAGETVYERIGALTMVRPAEVLPAVVALGELGSRPRVLSPPRLTQRWPHIRFPKDALGVVERDAGLVRARRALEAVSRTLAGHPRARLLPHHRVVALDPESGTLRVAGRAPMRARRIVVAAGVGSRGLLPERIAAGLTLYRQSSLYCRVPDDLRSAWDTTPAIPALAPGRGTWLVPPVTGLHLKLSAASACRSVSRQDDRETPAEWRDHLVGEFERDLVGFDGSWVDRAEDCYYIGDSATGDARMASLGGAETTVWAHAACGGGAFKFAPVIAETLAQRVLQPPTQRRAPRAPALSAARHGTSP